MGWQSYTRHLSWKKLSKDSWLFATHFFTNSSNTMFVNSANPSNLTIHQYTNYELVFCDFSKFVIRVETDPTDPTGVYRQEDNTLEVSTDNEVTVSSIFFYKTDWLTWLRIESWVRIFPLTIVKKNPLRNGNSPITDSIKKWE